MKAADARRKAEADELARQAEAKKVEAARKAAPVTTPAGVAAPAMVPVLLEAGRKALVAGKVRDAEAAFLAAAKVEPENARVCYNLGVLYSDYDKSPRKAKSYFSRYLKLAPNAPDAAQVKTWLMDLEAKTDW